VDDQNISPEWTEYLKFLVNQHGAIPDWVKGFAMIQCVQESYFREQITKLQADVAMLKRQLGWQEEPGRTQ
jgi:hypothetical protein